jgi:hypothetical protein
MSGWLVATREVYAAGGKLAVRKMRASATELTQARQKGLIARGTNGGTAFYAEITQRGIDLLEGRLEYFTPSSAGSMFGRRPGTHRRWRSTWLAALPRANEVRLTGGVQRAQNGV